MTSLLLLLVAIAVFYAFAVSVMVAIKHDEFPWMYDGSRKEKHDD